MCIVAPSICSWMMLKRRNSVMDDAHSLAPTPENVKRLRRKRSDSSVSNVDFGNDPGGLVALAFDAPGAIASGIQDLGRGLTGLVNKAGIGGDKPATPVTLTDPGNGGGFDAGSIAGSIGNAVSNVGEGIGKVAGAAGDGLGFVTSNAGSVVSGAGEVLTGAAEVAGTVLSAVGDVAGPAAHAASEVAGAAGEVVGAVLGGLGDLDL
jgi:hypothetical protein